MHIQIFGVTNKEHYGMLWSFWSGQLAAEKLEHSIKRPAILPKQSDKMPTLKTLAANSMVKDKIKYFENLSDKQASTITLHKQAVSL